MAPETYYVQTAFGSTYSPLAGAQLPIIYGLRNQLTILQVQLYNTGTVEALMDQVMVQADQVLTAPGQAQGTAPGIAPAFPRISLIPQSITRATKSFTMANFIRAHRTTCSM